MRQSKRQEWKEALANAFEAPKPLHKAEFLRKISPQKLPFSAFLFIQLHYIRRRFWIVSALVFAAALTGSFLLSTDMLWAISSFMPLLALITVTETGRSQRYEMAELEMSTCFSLRSVLLARLCILGLGNLALFFLLLPMGLWSSRLHPLQAGLYILTPFLLTTFLCLCIVRRHHGGETAYLCAGISVFIGLFVYPLRLTIPRLYEEHSLGNWIILSGLLLFGIARQYQNLITQEELIWNLS